MSLTVINRNSSLDFDRASTQYIDVGRVEEPDTAITLMCWSRPDDVSNNLNEGFIAKKAKNSNPWITYGLVGNSADSSYVIKFVVSPNATYTEAVSPSNAGISGWHHWAGTWKSGDYLRLYKDGVEVVASSGTASGNISYNIAGGPFKTTLGWNELDNVYLDAQLKYCQIFKRQLNASEVNLAMRYPFSIMDGCVGAWRLNNKTDMYDLSGHGHHGVNNGATLYAGFPAVYQRSKRRPSYKAAAVTSLSISVSDAITITENVTIVLPSLYVSVNDALTLTENISIQIPELYVSVNDSVTISENVSTLMTSQLSVSDAISVAEDVTILLPELYLSVNDALTITENVSLVLPELYLSVNDAVSVSEDVTILLPELYVSVNDAITVTESVTVSIPADGELSVSVSDSIAVSENVTVLLPELFADVSETISVSDVIALVLPELYLSVNDAVTITESVSASISTPSAASTKNKIAIHLGGNVYMFLS